MDGPRIAPTSLARQLADWDVANGCLHVQLSDAIRSLLVDGGLPPGAILPSRRELARVLAVSRTTVGTAYDTLREEGWLSTRHGAGTRVRMSTRRQAPDWHGDRLRTYVTLDSPLDLTSGALGASPILRRVLREDWTAELREALLLDRFVPRGLMSTRQAVADRYTLDGHSTTADQVVITNGSHHGLSVVADVLIQPGDVVLVEDPTYRGALDVFGRRGAEVVGVPCDAEGPDPLALEHAIRRRGARLLYALPTAHNVTGVTWSPARRRHVAAIVADTGIHVLDDRSTADLAGEDPPEPLGAHLPDDLSVSVGSLTKLFWSGIRVGWIRAGTRLIEAAVDRRLTTDLAGSIPSQVLSNALIPLTAEARALRHTELSRTRTLATATLATHLPEWTIAGFPAGACLWVDAHCDTVSLAARLARQHVAIVPGPNFSAANNWGTYVRFPLGRPDTLAKALPLILAARGATTQARMPLPVSAQGLG